MNLNLEDKVFAIVGGSAGMGFAAAEVLAEEKACLALLCRDEDRGQIKAQILRKRFGAKVEVFATDASNSKSVEFAFASIFRKFGGLDGLAVTAGPMQRMAAFNELGDDDWQSYFESQLMSTVRSCRAALPYLEARGGGNIVVTSAYSIRHQDPRLSAYSAMKQAVAGLSKNIAKSWGSKNIRCNCICPGAISTEALSTVRGMAIERYGEQTDPDLALDKFMVEEWQLDVALKRVGKPKEVGELIAFLLSNRAAYMTGALINIDGGTDF